MQDIDNFSAFLGGASKNLSQSHGFFNQFNVKIFSSSLTFVTSVIFIRSFGHWLRN